MKKFLSTICVVAMLFAYCTVISYGDTVQIGVAADENKITTSVDLKNLENEGWKMIPVSDEQVASAIMNNLNCSFEQAMKEVRLTKTTRLVVDNYMIYKDYKVTMDKGGAYVGTYRHYVMVTASGTGSLKWIDKVYTNSVSVLAKTGKFSWENGSSYVNSWSRDRITFTSVGNAVLTTSASIGATVAGVGVSVSENYYYRLQKTFKTSSIVS